MPGLSPLRQTATATASASSGALVDVIVLSADVALYDAIRDAIGERNPVWRARSAEESVDLLLTGRCGVLLVDLASVSTRPDSLIQQIVEQFPDVVVCVAGMRDDEPVLAPLISEGLVYRFMHKPLSPRRAGMFLQAAIRHHCERRDEGLLREPVLRLVTTLPGQFEAWKWVFVTIGVALFVMVLAVAFGRHDPGEQAAVAASAPGAAAESSPAHADPVLSGARAAFAAGRYESPAGRNALDLFKAVVLAHPDNAEARAGLARTIDRIMEHARQDVEAGRTAEAQRLVDRALEADPGRRSAVVLAQRLKAPAMEPVAATSAPATVVPGSTTTAARPVAPDAVPAYSPAARVTVTSAATAKVAAPASLPPVVRPDPLAPHYTNTAVVAGTVARRGTRAFGAPIASDLPVAGYVKPAPADEAVAPATSAEPASDGSTTISPALSADALERLVVTDPVYPPQALRNRTAGWVEMEFTVTATGRVGDIQVVDAEPRGVFEQAAATALGHWRFRPRFVNGQPVAQRSTVTMHFDVDG